ncbi:dual specificity phosphatase domain protein (macronuclear) [Tetrahymena thermophila SB210]|uniref:Dual specificity phosphatase domain protein n=1 Tax=Tetrahymena thermophila (strain SB210) TaxID=312017 RepID=Q22CR8_TETTS|nr:dual specificity phosphatase domain protein [Tetrahymena thermophila SB210]EAR83120.1 dual specificity phosphatase domain protein [Tetrahymena thermophila SB210]|eukprot:XP_001030783.1 dual specificity phosphatase domain protein [Tetrahymena thermophila SB210]
MGYKNFIILIILTSFTYCGVINSRVILVDKIGNNFLFRTNTPVQGDDYQMKELLEAMAEKISQSGYQLPQDPMIHSYSLVSFVDSIKQNYTEDKYFKNHTEYKFTHYPIFGSIVNPNSLPNFLAKFFSKYYPIWNHDNMNIITQELRENLLQQGERPKIIFFHCIAGEDRTGQVFGGYVMRYLNWSYQRALDFDNQVETRKINNGSKYGLNWYCYYLNNQEKGGDCTYEPNY